MPYFTKININRSRRNAAYVLSSTERMHAFLENLLPPSVNGNDDMMDALLSSGNSNRHMLWRVDANSDGYVVYMVSNEKPDPTGAVETIGWEGYGADKTINSIDYSKFLTGLSNGTEMLFRITVNPVKRNMHTGGIVPLIKDDAKTFINRKLKEAGVDVDMSSLRTVDEHNDVFFKGKKGNGRKVTLRKLTIEGRMTVQDADKLRNALVNGIGRGKSYGCGLLTVAPDTGK